MSAAIEVYMGREQAWHQLGIVTGREFSVSDMIEQAPELVMPVTLMPTFVHLEDEFTWGGVKYVETPEKAAVVRADGKVVGEGLGKDSYGIVQPLEMLEWGDAISGRAGFPLISAGTIREGRQFFFTYDTGGITPGGLHVDTHLTVCSSHDGTLAAMALHSTTVVVCANTLAMAISNTSDRTSLKHTSQVTDRLEATIRAIHDQHEHKDEVKETIQNLMSIQVRNFTPLLDGVLPIMDGTSAKKRENARSAVRGLLRSPVTEGFENTGWAAVQAINTWEQWGAPIRGGSRALRQFDSVVKGKQPLTDKMIELVLASA